MRISEVMCKMIEYSKGNQHDINHFLKVHAYAAAIAEQENVPPKVREIVEIAAILHDIACPLCREKYGNTNGKHQEAEGMPLARGFLAGMDLPEEEKERIVYLVGHHHTLRDVEGIDHQILIEADYLVNAGESNYPPENISNTMKTVFRTASGVALLQAVYGEEKKRPEDPFSR